jgi:DNA polymerase-3 subunit alpha
VYLDENNKWVIDDAFRKRYPELFKYVDIVNGTIVSIGSHPSGVLVSDLDIEEEVGMCSLATSDYPVSMLNMKELDALMYVKLDILGLDNVGVINETCKLAGIERLTPDNTDLDDEEVWRDIREDTTLIFQWESASAQSYLKRFMSDETIAIAKEHNKGFSYIKWFSFGNGLLRPGCASFRDDVADGNVLITGFRELDEFLSVTSGRITMQEDIMRFLVRFCGYSDAESDTVRRGIAKKYGTEKFIDEIHDRFLSYSNETYGEPIESLEEIFPPIKQGILDATRYAFSWNHSDAYSCIGYICGYLRHYYPLEFLTAALNIFEGKEEKTLNITNYTRKKRITVEGIKFRYSTSDYTFDKERNVIYKGIASIKYLNGKVADAFQSIKGMQFKDFIDLLAVKKEKGLPVNSKQMKILIELGFFEEFGEVKYLLKQHDFFEELYGKKQMKKDKAEKLGIPLELVRKNAEKESEKTFTKVDMNGLLHDFVAVMPYEKTTFVDKISYQINDLGYVDIVSQDYKGYVVVMDVETKYTPKLKVYALANGNTITVKVAKKDFNKNPLQKGDVVRVTNQKKKARVKMSPDGKFVPVENEFDWWLTKYDVIGSR